MTLDEIMWKLAELGTEQTKKPLVKSLLPLTI